MAEYISREVVLSKCDDIWNAADETTQTGVDTINTIDKITDFIESLPAADVQPVKRGRWIDIYEWAKMHDSTPSGMCTYYWCSECEKEQEKKSNFCPNCGAFMSCEETKKLQFKCQTCVYYHLDWCNYYQERTECDDTCGAYREKTNGR